MTSAVEKPWAPCPECQNGKMCTAIGMVTCPTCGGTGLAEFCAHVWVAKMSNYCVKCHILFEDRHD